MKSTAAKQLVTFLADGFKPGSALRVQQMLDDTEMGIRDWLSLANSMGNPAQLYLNTKPFTANDLYKHVQEVPIPLVVFANKEWLTISQAKKEGHILVKTKESSKEVPWTELAPQLCLYQEFAPEHEGSSDILTVIPIKINEGNESAIPSPVRRFVNLLREERKYIYQIYIYAILGGLLSLTLPLGVQSVVSLISGGLFLRPVVLLSAFVIVGVFLTGIMQVMQMTVVETVQQRIFSRTAIDFAFRIPRIRYERLINVYEPELVNRFFDVLSVQKGLTKILVELITALLQVFFGLLLLSMYHPFFVFFGLFLLVCIYFLFYFTARRGLDTSLYESKYKYAIAHWLEELGRNIKTFKLAGNSPLPIQKLEKQLGGYLQKRKLHFKVLMTQYGGFVAFKTGIVGGLLVLGSFLVIDRQISVGQFVAAELVIVLVINSIEKLIINLDTIYDVLTAVEKMGNLSDLPLEAETAPMQFGQDSTKGFEVRVENLRYRYPDGKSYALRGANMEVGECESVAIIGHEGCGKTTLMYVLAGILESYEGVITYNGASLRDINKRMLRDRLGDSLSHEHIFDGTLVENLTLARPGISSADLNKVLEITELSDWVSALEEGLQTSLVASGKGLPSSISKRLVLARSLLGKPKLVLFDDFFFNLESGFKKRLFHRLLREKKMACTFIISSHDPLVLQSVDRVLVMQDGQTVLSGTYAQIREHEMVKSLIL
ncbi:MAG: ATP-binding cassette domain-containing protein [Bacteroidetes bacterium]|nr:ATP-binding cassette domain-containing protein [Bacteroidota bacterium]